MIFYYVRHGDPIYDPNMLTPLGVRQAEAVAKRISRYPIDEIYASNSNRAMETAKPLTELMKKEMVLLPWASEEVAWEEMTILDPDDNFNKKWCFAAPKVKDFFLSPEGLTIGDNWMEHEMFKGTTIVDGYMRIRKETREFFKNQGFEFDEKLGKYKVTKKNDKRVVMYAHHGFGMAFMSNILNIPYPIMTTRFDYTHSTIQLILFDETKEYCNPVMITHGNDAHMYAENLPTRFENRIYY